MIELQFKPVNTSCMLMYLKQNLKATENIDKKYWDCFPYLQAQNKREREMEEYNYKRGFKHATHELLEAFEQLCQDTL